MGVHPPHFTNGEARPGEGEVRTPGAPSWPVSARVHTRCWDSHRCPGPWAGGAAPLRFPLPGAVRTYLPRTWAAAAAAGCNPSRCGPRGLPAGLRRKQQSPAAAAARLEAHVALATWVRIPGQPRPHSPPARCAHSPGPHGTGGNRSEAAAAAAAALRPPAPGGALGAAWLWAAGAHGGARPRAVGSIAGPVDQGGREESQPWAVGPDGHPIFSPALRRHLTCSSGLGIPTLLSQKTAGVQGKGR